MSSSGRRSGDVSLFRSKRSHFFKIILEDTIQEGNLVLPRKFVMEHGSSLPDKVFLRVQSTGAVWPVELAKQDNDAWLHHGWRVFAEYCCLDYGHLLVFEYEGCGLFHVLVFDKSATEISYSCSHSIAGTGSEKPKHDEKQKEPVIEIVEDDQSVEVVNDLIISDRAPERSPLPDTRPHKKMNNSTSPLESDSHSRETYSQCSESETTTTSSGSSAGPRCPKSKVVMRRRSCRTQKESEALIRALGFKSKNPFFKVAMRPSYISRYLEIPTNFGRKYLAKNQDPIILCIPDGRTWTINSQVYGNRPAVKFLNGWQKFVRDNRLKVGDVCVFELIDAAEIRLKVSIFQVDEDPTSPSVRSWGKTQQRRAQKTAMEAVRNAEQKRRSH